MKKTFILLGLLLLSGLGLFAQVTYQFEYDAAGNRTRRCVIVLDRGEGNLGSDREASVFQDQHPNGVTMKVFPNPTSGLVRFESNTENEMAGYQLFDFSGNLLEKSTIHGNSLTMDLSGRADGVYIIEIFVEKERYSYKIIKQ